MPSIYFLVRSHCTSANAALLAVRILATRDPGLREQLHAFAAEQTAKVLAETLPLS